VPGPSLSSEPTPHPGPPPRGGRETAVCPLCGRPAAPGDRFCERDGTPLGDDPTILARAEADDLAAATHRGRAHQVDEDAYAVGRRKRDGHPLHALVVCDGVSSSSHGEQAAARAAQAALDVLLAGADGPGPLDGPAALRDAVRAAHRAACAPGIEAVPGKASSGTTIVAALAHAGRLDVAWVGDSRAYLVRSGAAAELLTHDHSWLNEVVESGEMTATEAIHSPSAHALTHCLGPLENADPDQPPEPSLVAVPDVAGARLVLCSDGLWNSAAAPGAIAALVAGAPATADARALAVHLVRHGFAAGGHDDVTVAVAILRGD
jgi:PPM family protein phosphatase